MPELRASLLSYCELGTWAMVEVHRTLMMMIYFGIDLKAKKLLLLSYTINFFLKPIKLSRVNLQQFFRLCGADAAVVDPALHPAKCLEIGGYIGVAIIRAGHQVIFGAELENILNVID